jgi:uncharacterized protein
MLACIGPVAFDIFPFNMTGWSSSEESTFVEKSVLGIRPPLEWVGEGPASWSISAKLFPDKFGGTGDLAALKAARMTGLPQFFFLGNGTPVGWIVIANLKVKHTYLSPNGFGQVVECDIELKASGGPSAGAFFSIISGIEIGASLAGGLSLGGTSLSAFAGNGVKP